MDKEEMEHFMTLKYPEYNRDGVTVFINAKGGITIMDEMDNSVALATGQANEIADAIKLIAMWQEKNMSIMDFIDEKKQED